MSPEVRRYLESLKDLPLIGEDFDVCDINSTDIDGDNALHIAIRQRNNEAAKMLIEAGIDINHYGDLGETPLHVASYTGNMDIVRLLVDKGADVFALRDGDTPFTLARVGGQDAVCDFLAEAMEHEWTKDPAIFIRARIEQLKREIARLEHRLSQKSNETGGPRCN